MNKKILAIVILSMFLLTSLTAVSAVEIEERIAEKPFNLMVPENDILVERDESICTLDEIGEIEPIWTKSWNVADKGNDYGEDIAIDENYDYVYVAGYGQIDDRLFYNFLLQYDLDGKLQWYKILSKHENECGTCVCVDDESFVYVSYETGKDDGGEILYMLKYDRFGNEVWSESKVCLEVPWYEQILIISIVTDGNHVYMTGEIWGNGIGIYLLKTGINQDDECHQIAYWDLSDCRDYVESMIIHDNFIYVVGCSDHNNGDFLDAIILKYDTSGVLQWNLSYRYNPRSSADSIVIHDNSMYIAGCTGVLWDYWNIYLMKYDLNGNQLWSEPVIWGEDLEEWSFARAMTIDDGHIFIAGNIIDYFGVYGYDNALLLRFNLDGSFNFAKIWAYGLRAEDIQSYDGHLYISGIGGIIGLDAFLLKCDYNGDHGANARPSAPNIDGQSSGNVGKEYEYTFVSTDPEGEDVYYHIYWGDGEFDEWIGPYPSGQDVIVKHTWSDKGTYTVVAKAQDISGVESYWGTLKVTMPRNKAMNNPFLKFLENYQQIFSKIRFLLQLLGL